MRSTLKLLHLIGMAGFLGSLAAFIMLATHGVKGEALTYDVRHLTLPSLWIIVATGLVLTALQKQLAAWVYAKIAIGVTVLFIALFVFAPEVVGTGLTLLVLGIAAAALGIFRPRGKANASAPME